MTLRPADDCSHRPTCPGCPRFGESGIGAGAHAALARMADATGAALLPVRETDPFGYRHRARLMVRGRARSPKVGIFQAGSHRIAHIPHCRVHHPIVNRVAAELEAAVRATGCPPYADGPHRGCVRSLQVVVERASQRAQVAVVSNTTSAAEPSALADLLAMLSERLRAQGLLHSLWWNGNPERTNTILGPSWELERVGEGADEAGFAREEIGGASVFFHPGAFGQAHLALADAIVARVHAFADSRGATRIAEAHAGCGAIGLGLLARGARVAFNEQSPFGLAGLERGIAALGAEGRARVLPGAAGSCPELLDDAQLAIVDPPRRGLEPELAGAIERSSVGAVAYVSCDVASLERDLARWQAHGRLAVASLEPFALFPFTEHAETLALLEAR